MATSSTAVREFGDFQTPPALAERICAFLLSEGVRPKAVVEPTCGRGSLLKAALASMAPKAAVGLDVNAGHLRHVTESLPQAVHPGLEVVEADAFQADWRALFASLPEPVLVLGNPPWVTNAALGVLESGNRPAKSNFQRHAGIEAITGRGNFDVSEWLLLRWVQALVGRDGWLAMLCKTAVARKMLAHCWRGGIEVGHAQIRRIDAKTHFGVAVDACLLLCRFGMSAATEECPVFDRLADDRPATTLAFRGGELVADADAFDRRKHLAGTSGFRWRSGVKHDCAKVMELRRDGDRYRNGLGETVALEDDFVLPMLKSSELAGGRIATSDRWMVVPQRRTGDDAERLRRSAPRTWAYLDRHAERLARRRSSIYRGRCRFAVFGVGDYAFTPWKVAISGLYKRLRFSVVGPREGRPVVFDDTAYYLPCNGQRQAEALADLLHTTAAQEFLSAFVFWDAKRPVTATLLNRLDVTALAAEEGVDLEPAWSGAEDGRLPLFG